MISQRASSLVIKISLSLEKERRQEKRKVKERKEKEDRIEKQCVPMKAVWIEQRHLGRSLTEIKIGAA